MNNDSAEMCAHRDLLTQLNDFVASWDKQNNIVRDPTSKRYIREHTHNLWAEMVSSLVTDNQTGDIPNHALEDNIDPDGDVYGYMRQE